jgi:AraC-like DNA-binding protein
MKLTAGQWLQITSMVLVFVSLLLSFFLFTVKSKNRLGNTFLGLYLIINALDNSSYFYHSFFSLHPTVEMIRIEMGSFLKKPFLFLFVLTILYSNFKVRTKHLLHLAPLFLSTLVLLPRFYLADYASKVTLFEDHTHSFEGTIHIILSHFQFAFYVIGIFFLLARYKKILSENYSVSNRFNFDWLFQMNLFLSFLLIVVIVQNVYRYLFFGPEITEYRLLVALTQLVFICWLVLKAMYAPKIFSGVDSRLALVSTYVSSDNRDRSGTHDLGIEKSKQKISAMKEHMIKTEPYLNPELTIQDLASQMSMDVRETSLLINHILGQNFYDFINTYRINKAMEILKNPACRKLTVLEILYQVGFNSKSSFNTSFKKQAGFTPTEYRKRHGI